MGNESAPRPAPETPPEDDTTAEVIAINPSLSEETEQQVDDSASRHPAGHEHSRAYRHEPPEPLA